MRRLMDLNQLSQTRYATWLCDVESPVSLLIHKNFNSVCQARDRDNYITLVWLL